MKTFQYLYFIPVLSIFILSGCKDSGTLSEPEFTTETVTQTLTNEDVYFIFTNTSMYDNALVSPSVSASSVQSRSATEASFAPPFSVESEKESGMMAKIREFNEIEYELRQQKVHSRNIVPIPPTRSLSPSSDVVGGSGETFYTEWYAPSDPDDPNDEYYGTDIDATCRLIETSSGIQLSIWVEDTDWNDGTVNQTMVEALASKFIGDGPNGDIYEWVTEIYGIPWGDTADIRSQLINSSAGDYITILLYDIENDSHLYTPGNGYTVGFFWPKDNYSSSSTTVSGSNDRVMFYMDSFLYSLKDDTDWEIDDYWPASIISTLGHEFQHMIHYYQKQIIQNVYGSDVWLNEMCSLVTEDLIADKLANTGPRGVSEIGSVGSAPNVNGRLPLFNVALNETFLSWNNLDDYSTAYAFGAFWARNYGGAELFQKIVQSPQTDESAVVNAVNTLYSTNKTFKDLLIEWGIAVLYSDSPSETYQNNNGGYFSSTAVDSGTEFNLGPINLYNYRYEIDNTWNLDGPKIYNKIYNGIYYYPLSDVTLQPGTNTYYQAGTGLNGTHTWTVEVPENVTLTVVVK